MVYASPINLLAEDTVTSLEAGPDRITSPVRVFYRGTALDSITGPVPFVDLSIQYNNTEAGIPLSITTKATLSGKIVRGIKTDPDVNRAIGSGVRTVVSGIKELKNLFSCNDGHFILDCDGTEVIKSQGPVKVVSFSAKPSSDNWTSSADYTIELEFSEPPVSGVSSGSYNLVKDASDSWSIESLEDYLYMSSSITPSGKSEPHNPNITQATSTPNTPTDLKLVTLPRFKVSRKISAVGLPYATGNINTCGTGTYPAFYNAKNWVENQISKSFDRPTPSGQPVISSQAISSLSNFTKLFLYNHLRSINFNHLEASYEVNDTWLAMSSGVPYLEDYTIQSSTDEKNIKTVTVQGSIEGLVISNINWMKGNDLIPNDSGVIDLTLYAKTGVEESRTIIRQDALDTSRTYMIYNHKYANASSGWINDIKPFLYRRASVAMQSFDRNQNYVPYIYTTQPPLNNPIYSYERLLNTNPVSSNETHDPKKGSIKYSYEFTNNLNLFSGVLSESISINHTGPVDVFNQAFVLGRRLGPAIQSLGAKTSARKRVTIDLTVPAPFDINACFLNSTGCPLYTGGITFGQMEELLQGLKPFGNRTATMFGTARPPIAGQSYVKEDSINWNPAIGSFSRSVEWVYQYCRNDLTRSSLSEM